MAEHIAHRLHAVGRKRMLALDGGGTRGVVTIAFLAQIEKLLAERLTAQGYYTDPKEFRLSDYFDLIGGTSVGSIIATLLALGWRVEEVERTFDALKSRIFKSGIMPRLNSPRFSTAALSREITGILQANTLSSRTLKTGLCIVAKRVDTGSVWVMVNNRAARYWQGTQSRIANSDYLLHDLIRASTAAPTFFHPIEFDIFSSDVKHYDVVPVGRFVDGGVSPHNSPALLMLMLAGFSGYNMGGAATGEPRRGWSLGESNLLLTSVGTGAFSARAPKRWIMWHAAAEALASVIGDAQDLNLALLQWMGKTDFNWKIDREIGDLAGDTIAPQKMLTFQRYDVGLTDRWLLGKQTSGIQPGPLVAAELNRLGLANPEVLKRELPNLQKLINVPQMSWLKRLAAAAALEQVNARQFPPCFDQAWPKKPPVDRFPT